MEGAGGPKVDENAEKNADQKAQACCGEALWNEKPADVLSVMSTAEKVEAVYTGAKLSVIIVSFKCTKEKNEAQQAKCCHRYSGNR